MAEEEGASNELLFFVDKDETIQLITAICSANNSVASYAAQYDRLFVILNKYQEQPLLISAALQEMIDPLTATLLSIIEKLDRSQTTTSDAVVNPLASINMTHFHQVCKVIQLICKVRGYKHVNKLLPHEVNQLELCLYLLKQQNNKDYETWETRYVLLLWLNILCLIPFDICSLDSSLSIVTTTEEGPSLLDDESSSKLVAQIADTCREYLCDPGPTREAASACLSSLLTRPDMDKGLLTKFMTVCNNIIMNWVDKGDEARNLLTTESFQIIGVLHCIAQIYKKGDRSKLLVHCANTLAPCLSLALQNNQVIIRKLTTKLFQRIGMTFLPPRIASWRYKRGQRSLNDNINNTCSDDVGAANEDAETEDAYDIPGELESIIGSLLSALQDKDTIVRWSAAKGIGRITMRLPKDLADDVVAGVVDLFTDAEADSAWHGGCLALAELARRGLLLPERLLETVPIIEDAIQFDLLRGQHSVGAHVRDAACYVCWAFARAYSSEVMRPFVSSLSCTMLITALYDREVNCRRAASAAFQENVGRQGNQNFPNGIEIIGIADYFSLGNRTHSYLDIAPVVAKLDVEKLGDALRHHLHTCKLSHWDETIRSLAAEGLAKLTPMDVGNMIPIVRSLIIDATSSNLASRHGALLGLAHIILALSQCSAASGIQVLEADVMEDLINLVPKLDKARLYRGKGSDILRQASCLLIENIAKSAISISNMKQKVTFIEILNENLKQPHEHVQLAASNALRQVLFTYFGGINTQASSESETVSDEATVNVVAEPSEKLQKLTVLKYVEGLVSDPNVAVTRGSALALGALPIRLLVQPAGRLDEVLNAILDATRHDKLIDGVPDAETRKHAVTACMEIIEKLEGCHEGYQAAVETKHIATCLTILTRATNDYSIDKRGDTGSWSRIAALKSFERLLLLYQRHIAQDSPSQDVSVVTSYGVGIRTDITETKSYAAVQYPPASLGSMNSLNDTMQLHRNNMKVLPSKPLAAVLQTMFGDDVFTSIISILLKQLAEKLDAVRDIAGGILERIIQNSQLIALVPDGEHLRLALVKALSDKTRIDGEDTPAIINWSQPVYVFPFLANILDSEVYYQSIISGMVIAVGGLTETVVKASNAALLKYCQEKKASGGNGYTILNRISSALVTLFQENTGNDRIIVPLLKTLEVLLRNSIYENNSQCSNNYKNNEFAGNVYTLVHGESQTTNDVVKLIKIIDVLTLLLLYNEPTRNNALKALVVLLGHKYPRVRKYTSEQLYLQFLSDRHSIGKSNKEIAAVTNKENSVSPPSPPFVAADDVSGFVRNQDAYDRCVDILATTVWDSTVTIAREKRLELCSIMELDMKKKEVSDTSGKQVSKKVNNDELDSYAYLVRDAGY